MKTTTTPAIHSEGYGIPNDVLASESATFLPAVGRGGEVKVHAAECYGRGTLAVWCDKGYGVDHVALWEACYRAIRALEAKGYKVRVDGKKGARVTLVKRFTFDSGAYVVSLNYR